MDAVEVSRDTARGGPVYVPTGCDGFSPLRWGSMCADTSWRERTMVWRATFP